MVAQRSSEENPRDPECCVVQNRTKQNKTKQTTRAHHLAQLRVEWNLFHHLDVVVGRARAVASPLLLAAHGTRGVLRERRLSLGRDQRERPGGRRVVGRIAAPVASNERCVARGDAVAAERGGRARLGIERDKRRGR